MYLRAAAAAGADPRAVPDSFEAWEHAATAQLARPTATIVRRPNRAMITGEG
jgi:hypothetical protein